MKENDTLYHSFDKGVKSNGKDSSKLEEEKRGALLDSGFRLAAVLNKYNINTMKAYYYYRYFIANVLPILIKDCIKSYNDGLTITNVKEKAFDYELKVGPFSEKEEAKFHKLKNLIFISFDDFIIYKEFTNYLNMFCLRNDIGYMGKWESYYIYRFNSKPIGDILNAYYCELQRLEYTDELIKSIQEEENTNVNGEKVIKTIKTR